MSDARPRVSRFDALTRLLVGAATLAESARALGVPFEEVERLRRVVGGEGAALVPVAADLSRDTVELRDLRGVGLEEPFFADTIDRARSEQLDALDVEVDLETLAAAARYRGRSPDGFVFHAGRCGSTLLVNMLGRSGAHLVVKEPVAVGDVIAALLTARDNESRRRAERYLRPLIRYLLGSLPAPHEIRYRVVKFAAWNVQVARLLLDEFPATPAVFVYRSPLETVASLLFQRPAWFDGIQRSHEVRARFFPSLASAPSELAATPTVLFAHAWRSAVEAALDLPTGRLLTIDYQDIVDEPEQTISRVLSHLRHSVDPAHLPELAAAAAVYAKDPAERTPFDPHGTHRRPPLPPEEADVVRSIAADAWDRVAARAAEEASAATATSPTRRPPASLRPTSTPSR